MNPLGNMEELAASCDAIALCCFIGSHDDLLKIDYFQELTRHWNSRFSNSAISINYKSADIRNELRGQVEELFEHHFNNPSFLHNKVECSSLALAYCTMEEKLLHKCKALGYEFVCKTMDHVSLLEEAFYDTKVPLGQHFYYTNGIGCTSGLAQNFNGKKQNSLGEKYFTNWGEEGAEESYTAYRGHGDLRIHFFPQTNFYFLNIAAIDYIYNLDYINKRRLAWEADHSVAPNGRYITCEMELRKAIERNGGTSLNMPDDSETKLLKHNLLSTAQESSVVEQIVRWQVGDSSFKNLVTAGILHWGPVSLNNNQLQLPPVHRLV